jgi:uncharacterized delta-60 repeat protein
MWTKDYNGPASQDDKAYAITVDRLNNVYVAGYSTGIGTGTDIVVIKYNTGGSQLWIGSYNSTTNGDDAALSVAVDDSLNVYAAGYVSLAGSDMYLVKFNQNGLYQWGRFKGGTANQNDKAYAITIDEQDNIYTGGYTTNTSTGADFTLLKYNRNGDLLWTGMYDGPEHKDDIAVCLALSEENRVYLSGSSKNDTTEESEDYMTVRFNPETGDSVWSRRYAGSGEDQDKVYAITVDRLDNVIITGTATIENITSSGTSKDLDYLTIKYSPEGNILWTAAYDTNSNNETARAVFVSKSGDYVFVTGSTRIGNDPDSQDVATVKYDILTGNQMQASVIRGPGKGEDDAYGVYADSTDNVFIAGYMKNNTTRLDWFAAKYFRGDLIEVKNISTIVPLNHKLYQNYPNPFNPSTSIKFDVASTGHIKIVVYDMLGRQVETLVNESLRSGTYEVNYNAANLSSGVYFYELITEDYRNVKK